MTLGSMSQSKRRSGCDGIGGLLMPLATFVVSSAAAEGGMPLDGLYRAVLPSRASLAFKDFRPSPFVSKLRLGRENLRGIMLECHRVIHLLREY
jgi:hypothetical protein